MESAVHDHVKSHCPVSPLCELVSSDRRAAPEIGATAMHAPSARESGYGYKPTRAGLVETQPNPRNLHALITPPELLNVTPSRHYASAKVLIAPVKSRTDAHRDLC